MKRRRAGRNDPSGLGFTTETAESLADRTFKQLESLIVTAELAPGQWLTEVGISRQLGISRTPVREALQRLAQARLVEVVQRRGLRVSEINLRDHLLLLEFRREVERYVVMRAARRCAREDRALLIEMANGMDGTAATNDIRRHYELDSDFKLLLLRNVDNQYAADAVTPLWAGSRRFAWVNRFSRDIPYIAPLCAALMRAVAGGTRSEVVKALNEYIDALIKLARGSIDSDLAGGTLPRSAAPQRRSASL